MAALKWTDTLEIAIQLSEAHPAQDPAQLRFTALMAMVQALPEFDDAPER
ncbi:MAG TPA: Fe-S cluster assembly protein IscX, partial [Casimicrobium sp.]|nr:Fe-S cluster assembly protein IscX [Casimicrobium sp.]